MEIKRKKIIGIVLIVVGICLILFINSSFLNNKIKKISKEIELDSYDCNIIYDSDTHGGFLGDGDYFAKINCSNINYDKLSSNWKELPLTESLNRIMEMKQCNNGCKSVYERFLISNTLNGFYYFVDRHSDSINKYDDSDINNRSSYNFTLALLDKDNNIIYFYRLDT